MHLQKSGAKTDDEQTVVCSNDWLEQRNTKHDNKALVQLLRPLLLVLLLLLLLLLLQLLLLLLPLHKPIDQCLDSLKEVREKPRYYYY